MEVLLKIEARSLTLFILANSGFSFRHAFVVNPNRDMIILDCGITDVIELSSDEPSTTGGNTNEKTERKSHREQH